MSRIAGSAAVTLILLGSGCLQPIGDEHAGYSAELRGRGARIPSVDEDELFKNRILNNDGIDGETVALRTGFVDDTSVRYWDFGTLMMGSLEPIWSFVRRGKDGSVEPIDHHDLVDSIPGDANYSPLRAHYQVFVTAAYAGERITSLRALEDAIELGLVEEPAPATEYLDRPIAPASVQLPFGDEREPLGTVPVYYRGHVAAQLRLGGEHERAFPIAMGPLPTPNAYALRRQGQASALDEALWKLDLDGDGTLDDTNLVLGAGAAAPTYSALWRSVEVIVPSDYVFGDCRSEGDMFMRNEAGLQAQPGEVLSWQTSELLRHLVLVEGSDE